MRSSARAAKVAPTDELVDEEPRPGQVILHQGDTAFAAGARTSGGKKLPATESIFLRLIAYLAFADAVCIPARHLLVNRSAFEACQLAEPLLQVGLIRPERRAEVGSFSELAVVLNLGGAERTRGEWLDVKVGIHARVFNSLKLGARYREILLDDLASGTDGDSARGGLRIALGARLSTAFATSLDQAFDEFGASALDHPRGFRQRRGRADARDTGR